MPYIKKEVLRKLVLAGSGLANAAFNLKQREWIPDHIRKSLEEGQKDWDKVIKEIDI